MQNLKYRWVSETCIADISNSQLRRHFVNKMMYVYKLLLQNRKKLIVSATCIANISNLQLSLLKDDYQYRWECVCRALPYTLLRCLWLLHVNLGNNIRTFKLRQALWKNCWELFLTGNWPRSFYNSTKVDLDKYK